MHCRFSRSGSMMKRMSFSETIFLFLLALVIFGPKKLPEIARQVGKYLNEFKRASNEFKSQIEQEIAHLEVEKPSILPPTSVPAGTTSRGQSAFASPDVAAAEPPATLAASNDQPVETAEPAPRVTEAVPVDAVTSSSTSQESHV
jgi:sec-independent protein translocase protein TatB